MKNHYINMMMKQMNNHKIITHLEMNITLIKKMEYHNFMD